MDVLLKKTGSCVCGAVRFTLNSVKANVSACHCSSCKKWGGAPYFAVKCGTDVIIEGESNIKVFDSSEWAERGFCQKCGTHLFYRFKESKEYRIPLGFLDDEEGLFLEQQYFVDMKSCVYQLNNKTDDLTAAEVFARFKK